MESVESRRSIDKTERRAEEGSSAFTCHGRPTLPFPDEARELDQARHRQYGSRAAFELGAADDGEE